MLTGWGQMRAKAATSVNSMSDMLVGGAGNDIADGDYILEDNVGDGRFYHVESDTTINLNDKQLNALLGVSSGMTLNISGPGSLLGVYNNGHVNQNGGNVSGATSAAGQYELISGSIDDAVVYAGSIIQTGGEVDGVIFYANGTGAYSISDGEIKGDVTFESGSSCTLTVSGSGVISGDIDLAGGTLIVNGGTISGDIIWGGGTLSGTNNYKIRVTFNPNNGGTTTSTANTGADHKLASLPADPTWSGHTFLGWFTQASGGDQITTNTVFTSPTTVYAHWQDDTTGQIAPPNPARNTSDNDDDDDHHSSHKKHTTASADYYYNEETGLYGGLIDGVFAPTTMIPASAYPKFNSFLVKKIQSAEAGSTVSVNSDPWTSINKPAADAFTEKGDIALALTYKQGDQPCEVTVPAGANLTEQLDENGYLGFAKMGALYGAAPVVETEQ